MNEPTHIWAEPEARHLRRLVYALCIILFFLVLFVSISLIHLNKKIDYLCAVLDDRPVGRTKAVHPVYLRGDLPPLPQLEYPDSSLGGGIPIDVFRTHPEVQATLDSLRVRVVRLEADLWYWRWFLSWLRWYHGNAGWWYHGEMETREGLETNG